jgi:hypothetical protein
LLFILDDLVDLVVRIFNIVWVLHHILDEIIILGPFLLVFATIHTLNILHLLISFILLLIILWILQFLAIGSKWLLTSLLLLPLNLVLNPLLPQLLLLDPLSIPLLLVIENHPDLLQALDKLLEVEVLGGRGHPLEDRDELAFGNELALLALVQEGRQREILQELEETVHRHVCLLVLQSVECHVLAHSEDVCAVVLEDLLQVHYAG